MTGTNHVAKGSQNTIDFARIDASIEFNQKNQTSEVKRKLEEVDNNYKLST
jgi:archaellum component FlaC